MLLRGPARPAVIREHPMAPWLAVATVCFGAFMGQLDASVVTLAFPALQRQFGVALAGVQWVSLAYLLALVALLVPVGRWSDRMAASWCTCTGSCCSPRRRRRAGWRRRCACWLRSGWCRRPARRCCRPTAWRWWSRAPRPGGGGRHWGCRPARRRWAWRWARWRAGCWSPRLAGARSSSSMSRSGRWRWRRAGSCCRAPAIAPPARAPIRWG